MLLLIEDLYWRLEMKVKKIIDAIYLILLGASIGGVLTLGIIMTSTIFRSELYIGDVLSLYQEGRLMAQGFDKFSYFLGFMAIVIMSYEMYSYKILQRDNIVLASTFIALSSIGLFIGVYTPKILALQEKGVEATEGIEFQNLHLGSELDFKVLVGALIVLMFRRLYVLLTK